MHQGSFLSFFMLSCNGRVSTACADTPLEVHPALESGWVFLELWTLPPPRWSPPCYTPDSKGQRLHLWTEGAWSRRGVKPMARCEGGRKAKVNTFNSRLKLLIPAYLYTINYVCLMCGGQLGLSFPCTQVFALPTVCPEKRPPPTHTHMYKNTHTLPNVSFSFRLCHLHWFSICFLLAADHQL